MPKKSYEEKYNDYSKKMKELFDGKKYNTLSRYILKVYTEGMKKRDIQRQNEMAKNNNEIKAINVDKLEKVAEIDVVEDFFPEAFSNANEEDVLEFFDTYNIIHNEIKASRYPLYQVVKEQMKKGEIKETEFMKDSNNIIDKVSLNITKNLDEAYDLKVSTNIKKTIMVEIINHCDLEDIDDHEKKIFEDVNKYSDDEEELRSIKGEMDAEAFLNYKEYDFKLNEFYGGHNNVFSKRTPEMEVFYKGSKEELDNYVNDLKTNIQNIKVYESAVDNTTEEFKALYNELEDKSELPEFKSVVYELENFTKFNEKYQYGYKNDQRPKAGEKTELRTTLDAYEKKGIDWHFKELSNLLEPLKKKDNETYNKVNDILIKNKESIEFAYNNYAKEVYLKEKAKYNNCSSKRLCAMGKMNVKAFKNSIVGLNRDINNCYKYYSSDKDNRNELERDKHKEYLALTESLEKISELNNNMDKYTPKQIVEMYRNARNDAKNYVDTHDGFSNFTSGWSSKGRERIKFAKEIMSTLDIALESMVKDYQNLTKELDEKITIENAPKAFEDKKNELQQLQQCMV